MQKHNSCRCRQRTRGKNAVKERMNKYMQKIGRKSTWEKVALISKKIDSFAIDYPFTLLNWHTEEWNSADERILNFRKENMKRNGTAENRTKKRASYRDEGTMQCEKSDGEIRTRRMTTAATEATVAVIVVQKKTKIIRRKKNPRERFRLYDFPSHKCSIVK